MTDTTNNFKTDNIKMSVPNKPEYVSVIRLTTSGLANKIGFNIEEIDDIKVAIAEACTLILKNGLQDKNIDIEFDITTSKMVITVKGHKPTTAKESSKEEGLGLFIIKSLMDDVDFISDEKSIQIKMIKEIEDVAK